MTEQIIVLLFIAFIAFFYSAVGHGGASGYLAVLSIAGLELAQIKTSALLLNVLVAGVSFFQFYRARHFNFKLFYPFAIAAIPMAYMGSLIQLNPEVYKQVLGFCLLAAVLRMLGVFNRNETDETKSVNLYYALLIGAVLGFVSGVIGIGGGIFLSPIILLLRWGTLKQTAAVSSLFIVTNSLAGILGMMNQKIEINTPVYLWLIVAMLAGFVGAAWGSKIVSSKLLKNVLAIVLFVAAIKLIFIA